MRDFIHCYENRAKIWKLLPIKKMEIIAQWVPIASKARYPGSIPWESTPNPALRRPTRKRKIVMKKKRLRATFESQVICFNYFTSIKKNRVFFFFLSKVRSEYIHLVGETYKPEYRNPLGAQRMSTVRTLQWKRPLEHNDVQPKYTNTKAEKTARKFYRSDRR